MNENTFSGIMVQNRVFRVFKARKLDCVVKVGSFSPMPIDISVVCTKTPDDIAAFVESMAGAVEMNNYISVADLQVCLIYIFIPCFSVWAVFSKTDLKEAGVL